MKQVEKNKRLSPGAWVVAPLNARDRLTNEERALSFTVAKQSLSGWGRYKPQECAVYRPERRSELFSLLDSGAPRPFIPRGLGRSYGDAAVNPEGSVIDMTRQNNMIRFDPETGLLECEGGVSLAEILEAFVGRGYFLPVTPGTKFVTVAGAIANDVHGKNHHCDGSFSRFVESFELWTPTRGILTCSDSENSDIFQVTVGGAGLTGVILKVRLRLRRVESAYVKVDYQRCNHLDAALEAMAASDKDYLYSVAWVDCLASKESLGRSVLMRGNHARVSELPGKLSGTPYRLPRRPTLAVPVDFPGFALNRWSIHAFNTLFYATNKDTRAKIVDYDKFFYPLDGILRWNRMYGKKGFIQYQATFPFSERAGLVQMLERLAQAKRASFLVVLKCFGEAGSGMLSYPMPGYTLALDIPNRPGLEEFTRELDRILLDHGGRLYLAKDALTAPETFAAMYPNLDAFREMRRSLDPENVLRSTMSRRLHLDK